MGWVRFKQKSGSILLDIPQKAEIKAEYDNVSKTETINFVKADGQFLLLNANYDDTNKQATLTFTQNVSNLQPGMIKVTNNATGQNVTVTDVKADKNKVVLTFKNALKDDASYTVRVADDVDVDEDGIPETLCDKYGRTLKADNKTTILTVEDADLVAKYDAANTHEISFEINGLVGEDTQKVLCVYEGGYKVVDGDETFAVDTVLNTKPEVTEVKCYYNGAVKTVKLTDRITDIAKAEAGIAAATVATTPVTGTYGANNELTFAGLTPAAADTRTYNVVKAEVVSDAKSIFQTTNTVDAVKIASTAVTDVTATAKVKVTYADSVRPFVQRVVYFDVTLSDADWVSGEKVADTITFTKK